MKLRARVWVPTLLTVGLVVACHSDAGTNGGGGGSVGTSGAAGAAAGATGLGGGGASSGSAGSSAGANTAAGAAGSSGGADTGGAGGAATAGAAGSSGGASGAGGAPSKTTFFVTSDTSKTANLGGVKGADARCQMLAVAAGFGAHTFHAYLSAEHDPDDANKTVNARDRIGAGPWYNSAGVLLAQNLTALHAMNGNADLFLDEKGKKINGQWTGSPQPVEHDVLTGSDTMGKLLVGKTCSDWTSTGNTTAMVGHTDGLGPGGVSDMPYNYWMSSHENGSCGDTAPKGGAGRLYCFAIN